VNVHHLFKESSLFSPFFLFYFKIFFLNLHLFPPSLFVFLFVELFFFRNDRLVFVIDERDSFLKDKTENTQIPN